MNPFEALGRATLRAETAEEQARTLLGLLQQLKSGELPLSRLEVSDGTVRVLPAAKAELDEHGDWPRV